MARTVGPICRDTRTETDGDRRSIRKGTPNFGGSKGVVPQHSQCLNTAPITRMCRPTVDWKRSLSCSNNLFHRTSGSSGNRSHFVTVRPSLVMTTSRARRSFWPRLPMSLPFTSNSNPLLLLPEISISSFAVQA
jgi:hypothetical protein